MLKSADFDSIIDHLVEAIRPLVAIIEAAPPTTKGHYGDYMATIERVTRRLAPTPTTSAYLAVGIALERAGANKFGVESALRAMGHLDAERHR